LTFEELEEEIAVELEALESTVNELLSFLQRRLPINPPDIRKSCGPARYPENSPMSISEIGIPGKITSRFRIGGGANAFHMIESFQALGIP
jgi:hypothetical protein